MPHILLAPLKEANPYDVVEGLNSGTETPSRREKPGVIEPVQYLRALAAMMVVFSHANDQLRTPGIPYWPELGHFGVDLFFVISGFIMLVITEQREQSPQDFLLSRILRIAPIYWFWTTVAALLAVVAPLAFRGTVFTPLHYLQSLLFIAHPNPADPASTSPLLKLGWTLNYEMFFYLVFTIAIALSFRARAVITAVVLGVFIAIGWILAPPNPVAAFYTRDIMIEFLFGMGVGWLYVSGRVPRLPVICLLVFGAACLFWANFTAGQDIVRSPLRGLVWGIPAAGVLFLALGLRAVPGRIGRVLKGLGDASYTIYLVHLFPVSLLRILWIKVGLPTQDPIDCYAFVVVALIVAATCGYAAYWLIERPAMRITGNLRRRMSSANGKRVAHAAQ